MIDTNTEAHDCPCKDGEHATVEENVCTCCASTVPNETAPKAPTLGPIRKERGVAGQIAYSVAVTYADEPTSIVTFVGSTYGGPVVMVTGAGHAQQTFVTEPERFGPFGPEWVRRFFS